MKLEEAIKELKSLSPSETAIETVLQALENSIPKKKIEDKIEELEQQRENATEENQIGTGILLTGGINYLHELLEDK